MALELPTDPQFTLKEKEQEKVQVPVSKESIPIPQNPLPVIKKEVLPVPQSSSGDPEKPPVPIRAFADTGAARKAIFENVFNALASAEPITQDNLTLKLTNLKWVDPERISRRDRKAALLKNETLGRRIRGTWQLIDNTTNQVLGQKNQVVARVPYLSSMGTFLYRGNEYVIQNQQRLKPGIYTREKENGEIETHVNIIPGKGVAHRYMIDPEQGVFKIHVAQANIPLFPFLKLLGATDKELEEAWGKELYYKNAKQNSSQAIEKLKNKFLSKKDLSSTPLENQNSLLVSKFLSMEVDPTVNQRTLGKPYNHLSKDVILDITKKIIKVSRGEQDTDDRDHLAYQSFYGPEDLFKEKIEKDPGGYRRRILNKIFLTKDLSKMPSGLYTRQLDDVLINSGLAQPLEEINPLEIFDKQTRVTRMGVGGIPSVDSIPDEARGVHPSQMGFIDPIKTPESLRAGIDVNFATAAYKGSDGTIYAQFIDYKTGKKVWRNPMQLADAAIATPGSLKWAKKYPRIPVLKGGYFDYVKPDEVDYVLPHFETATSPLSNLVAAKEADKAHRLGMGSRYITQALPLATPEAPFVQTAVPGKEGKSFEDELSYSAGVEKAKGDGIVEDIRDGVIKVRRDDGTLDEFELYEYYPFNRKTYLHQTPLVKIGDSVKKGQILARSNFTDEKGQIAIGTNLRTAYLPWKGYNFKDAMVISESAAKKLTSQHMYQHQVDMDNPDVYKLGKNNYISLFPQKYDKATLENFDENGVIKVGTKVEFEQPLILAAKEQELTHNKIHKQKQKGFVDASVIWKHHTPGIVTNVVQTKTGPLVTVRADSPAEVGDKLSGRHGDKGVIAAILPDGLMPRDAEGKPFELLLSPLGIISRTNPGQVIEGWLGKIARKTGQPYKLKSFQDENLLDFVNQELAKHGLSALEEVVDPANNRKIKDVATGERFMMKLHHTVESKLQGRGVGGYSADGTPAKGGETGCFIGSTPVLTLWKGKPTEIPIEEIVEGRLKVPVLSYNFETESFVESWVTDYFKYKVPVSDLLEIELENGKTIIATKNHVFYLENKEKVLAQDLKEGDSLLEVIE